MKQTPLRNRSSRRNLLRGRRELRRHLNRLSAAYDRAYLNSDPLSFPRRYRDPEDQEVVAWLAAALAYGQVKVIHQSVSEALARLGDSPAKALSRIDPAALLSRLEGFRHRFTSGRDLAALLWVAADIRRAYGGLETFFRRGYSPDSVDLRSALISFVKRALERDLSVFYSRRPRRGEGIRYLLPSPETGSACKRLNLFLRWMVRRDDGIDLGLWRTISPRQLLVPVDTHIARISRYLGLTRRKNPGWKMTEEITGVLRRLDPKDPVRYDFALSRLGILDSCPRRRSFSKCAACMIQQVCQL